MPRLSPLRHREVVAKLRRLGYEGPESGSNHPIMTNPVTRKTIPVPNHGSKDIGIGLIRRIIRQAGITVEEWLEL